MLSQTHFDILTSRISIHAERPFYKPLKRNMNADGSPTWTNITYAELGKDIDALAFHLRRRLRRAGVPDRAVVGVQFPGFSYSDVVHMYALCRAGYVPDMLIISVTNPELMVEMLRENDAKALLHASNLELPGDCGIFSLTPVADFEALESNTDLPSTPEYNATDMAFINRTSGSTTKPKAVVCTNKWFESVYASWTSVWIPAEEGEPLAGRVYSSRKRLSAFRISCAQCRHSFRWSVYSHIGGLNRMNTFAPLLIPHFMAAQAQLKSGDDSILKVLRNMRSIVYGGMPMLPMFEDWAFENKIPLMNSPGTTEAGPLLHSHLGHHPYHMVPFNGIDVAFEPQAKSSADEEQLFALAVLPTSPNIPSKASCSENGKFYTGDLFSRNEDGTYSHPGRDDDWIKVGNAYLIDANPSRRDPNLESADAVKSTIMERMAPFHQRRMPWEQITLNNIVCPSELFPEQLRETFGEDKLLLV
ncbi:hypothetical protein C8R45DRAFT_1224351 [Mycena sanguinolenta]|nr:hypothetical protein C8R45DRAFT_1224351 [Mycena sanguinolenta]